ncbi:MAG: phenylacetate--CoA ligase family protein [Planctomycetaceae bacterium]|nr:phenylacetate--CoA ligase family protein [Planctomycetaceae bacterium]
MLDRLLDRLEESQWWPKDKLQEYQFGQLRPLMQHASARVPYYARLFREHDLDPDQLLSPKTWYRLPLLTRSLVQEAGSDLHSSLLPEGHTPVSRQLTSGSTGSPVESLATPVTSLFWRAMTVRDHRWHGRDFSGKLASIHYTGSGVAEPPHGLTRPDWGTATRDIGQTGLGAVLSIFSTTAEQAAWLNECNPHYLVTYPSALKALAQHCEEQGHHLTNLRNIRTFGEVLDPSVRELCRRVWNVSVADTYSTVETGFLALQCSDHEHLHVMSEDVLMEVLDDDDRPCQPGETGRVVVTTLNNYAMPLLRYDIGDYAEVGEPCPCGRGLPVLKRVLGRSRNLFVLPGGDRVWPSLELSEETDLAQLPVRQYQIVQTSQELVEAFVVAHRSLTTEEESIASRAIQRAVRHSIPVKFHYVEAIPRSPTGKYEEFRSDLRSTSESAAPPA